MDDAFALLRLQVEWGADEAIDLDPVDRFGAGAQAHIPDRPGTRHQLGAADQPGPIEAKPAILPRATVAPAGAKATPAQQALALAAQAATLQELRAALADFDGCALRDTASNLVFAEGNAASQILIIGEPPGREEDRGGHAFAGAEGQLLDQMLASIGLARGALMLTPLVPWRPPGGRPPSAAEIAICQPFLHRLVVLLKPRLIVLFGGTAARSILPQSQNRRRTTRGWVESTMPGMQGALPALALPGLADMLKNPQLRREAWMGLRLLRRTINEDGQTQT